MLHGGGTVKPFDLWCNPDSDLKRDLSGPLPRCGSDHSSLCKTGTRRRDLPVPSQGLTRHPPECVSVSLVAYTSGAPHPGHSSLRSVSKTRPHHGGSFRRKTQKGNLLPPSSPSSSLSFHPSFPLHNRPTDLDLQPVTRVR